MAGSQRELTAGELLGMTRPRHLRGGIKTEACSPKPASRMDRSSPRVRPLRMVCMLRQRMVNLGHVAPHHDVRQAAGGGKRFDILPRRLRVALVAQGSVPFEK